MRCSITCNMHVYCLRYETTLCCKLVDVNRPRYYLLLYGWLYNLPSHTVPVLVWVKVKYASTYYYMVMMDRSAQSTPGCCSCTVSHPRYSACICVELARRVCGLLCALLCGSRGHRPWNKAIAWSHYVCPLHFTFSTFGFENSASRARKDCASPSARPLRFTRNLISPL